MKIIDRSGRNHKSIVAIAGFVKRYFSCQDKAVVLVEASPQGSMSSGLAYHTAPIKFDKERPSMIVLLAGRLGRYPVWSKYIDEAGPVQFNSWEEELVFVLAHELQHIEDFWKKPGMDAHTLEVRAEHMAAHVLVEFRCAVNRIKMKRAA